jgi:lipopolysaccharide export system protein LptA
VLKFRYAKVLAFVLLHTVVLKAQNPETLSAPQADTLRQAEIGVDSVARDSIAAPAAGAARSDIETTIKYNSADSIYMDLKKQIVRLFGNAKIEYGTIELEAAIIEIDYATNIISARSVPDSTGKPIGKPVFKDGQDTYETDDMRYNFKTKKALIDGVVTQQGDAIMQGEKVFKNQFDEMYIQHARYSTCNLPEPHFHIDASKIKVIPGKKVVAGPFHMRVRDIPLPLGFAFGMFPVPKQQTSGIVVPSYGEEKRRGFFLRNGGYYFAINEYVDLTLLGEIYSKGSYGLNMASSYNNRYKYNGQFNVRMNKQRAESEGDSTVVTDLWINWSHSPKTRGTSRFSASVSAGTQSYNQNNPTADLRNTLNQDFNSSVSFSKSFRGTPFNLSATTRMQQNVNTGIFSLLLPDIAMNMNRIYPFKFGRSNARNPLQKINLAWNMSGTNRVSNRPLSSPGFNVVGFDPQNQDTLKLTDIGKLFLQGQNGFQHRIPVSTSMNLLKFINLNPSLDYQELWYFRELDYTWVEDQNAVKIDTLEKFSRAYAYSASFSFDTRLYGIKYFKPDNKIQAIRHVMIPSFGMSFSPDFSDEKFGYFQEVQIDSLGNRRRLSKYQNFVYGTPSAGQNASAFLSLSNNLEMKVKSENDTTDKPKKVMILENFSLNASYNFLADSFKVAPFNFTARTRLFNKKLNVNFGTTVDPYIWELDTSYVRNGVETFVQRRRDILAWNAGKGLGQVTSARLALGASFSPKSKKDEEKSDMLSRPTTPQEEMQLEFMRNNPELYVDFNIPWNLTVNYNLSYTRQGFADPRITQAIDFSGNLTLTEKWNVGFRSGFDFQALDFTQTNFNITRDLHCWQLNFSWTPFGRYESYFLTINAKSSLLQDLKVNKQRSWWDN